MEYIQIITNILVILVVGYSLKKPKEDVKKDVKKDPYEKYRTHDGLLRGKKIEL